MFIYFTYICKQYIYVYIFNICIFLYYFNAYGRAFLLPYILLFFLLISIICYEGLSCQYVDMYLINFSGYNYISLFEYTKILLIDVLFNILCLIFNSTLLYILLCNAGLGLCKPVFFKKPAGFPLESVNSTC